MILYSFRRCPWAMRARLALRYAGCEVEICEVAMKNKPAELLALSPNPSWNLLEGLLQERAWGVETSTANSEVVGRRHYGRKAVAPGGGGGAGATRELLDTLLLWQGDVPLNAQGEAVVDVPINDALTRFRLVAVASSGLQRFGTGQAEIRVTQDLQVLPGLPPLVREGDRFEALVTVRNTTTQDHELEHHFDYPLIALSQQALREGKAVLHEIEINNTNQAIGTMLGNELTKRWGALTTETLGNLADLLGQPQQHQPVFLRQFAQPQLRLDGLGGTRLLRFGSGQGNGFVVHLDLSMYTAMTCSD